MSIKQKFTVILAGVTLVSSVVSAAGAPGNVSNASATVSGNTVNVSWSQVSNAAFYRVYYSHQSILNNGGDYDDTDRTQGNTPSYTFQSLPFKSGKLYIAILAVSGDGMESEGFETEASVDLLSAETPPAESASASPSASASSFPSVPTETIPVVTSIPMTLSEVKAVSETGVLITFTKPLLRGNIFHPQFFLVSDGSGVVLETGTGVITGSGMSILLSTFTQDSTTVYYLSILEPVPADDGTNLPTNANKISFGGFTSSLSVPASVSSASSVSYASIEDIPYVRNPVITEPPSVVVVDTPKTDLPDSGIGLFGISVVSGILAGKRMRRRK
ncbi:hypothetical protein EXS65_02685 [Candidatus Peribacteria bacterium]|nr:hypothetical protein [Candidatus Peribacteria bacterium]